MTPTQRHALVAALASSDTTRGELTADQQAQLRYSVANAVIDAGRPAEVAAAIGEVAVVLSEISADEAKKIGSTSAECDEFARDFGLPATLAQRAHAAGFTSARLSALCREHLRDRRSDSVAAFVVARIGQAEIATQLQQRKAQ